MFTGIVQGKARVDSIISRPGLNTLVIELPAACTDHVAIGASVAINGTCLTVTRQEGNRLWFDAMQETLQLTTLGNLADNATVNFERAARIGDEIRQTPGQRGWSRCTSIHQMQTMGMHIVDRNSRGFSDR